MATIDKIAVIIDEERSEWLKHGAPAMTMVDRWSYKAATRIVAIIAAEQVRASEPHELVAFLGLWADRYQYLYKLDGLHPVHFDLMKKYGARMDSFKRATNASDVVD